MIVSSYYPSECSGCGKRNLSKSAEPLAVAWKRQFAESRNALISKINSGQMTLAEMARVDTRLRGHSSEDWVGAGILSDCCKLEILSYIPYDHHLRDYNDANAALPPDMIESVQWTTMQSEGAQPMTVSTTGTNLQYSS